MTNEIKCPYCGSKVFVYRTGASVKFTFDDKGAFDYIDTIEDGEITSVLCDNCGKEIPESIWIKWPW